MAASITPDMAAQAGLAQDVQQKIRLDALRTSLTPRESDEKKLRGACQGFESVFVNKLLSQMRSSLPKEGLLHSKYEEQYLSMFDQELADKISKDGGVGIAQMMYDQLSAKLHPAKPEGSPQSGDIYAKHAVSRFPQHKSQDLHGDVTAKDGMRSLAAANRRAPGESSQAGETGQSQAAATGAQPGAAMATPCDGTVSSGFGWRSDPVSGQSDWHSGVDIQAPKGTAVDACWDGKVVFAGERGGYGKCVVIEHSGGWQSIYGHNSNIVAQVGQAVRAGQKIAEVGSTGKATGAHLHFELRQDGVAHDPIGVQMAALGGSGQSPNAGGATQVASR
ncbi:MAG: peptidoglycan DD-metalloendopeptidase family protein [Desulfovibrionaceae bacterium]|nr:peptidoglycan DD-metalloendopeptidase family protein [Desulfovibrionaceae bacterium]MBF0512957.1 peptidoglycan DD-metalloendopeptidase family protein [Desulfovibrionaceae bacterium]